MGLGLSAASVIAALVSFRLFKKRFHTLEVAVCWFFLGALLLMLRTFFVLNAEMLKVTHHPGNFIALSSLLILLFPCVILWLLYLYRTDFLNAAGKLAFALLWAIALSLADWWSNEAKLMQFVSWNLYYSFVKWVLVIALAWGVMAAYRRILRKEGYLC
ncbi:MAG TPA: hypothetical protein VF260_06165 [Bacilli bacterium]